MTSNEGAVDVPFHDRRKIRRERILAGQSQAETARRAEISAAHLCNIELGNVASPSPEVLGRIADAIGCTIADFERDTPTRTNVAEVG
ncbi:helix-turn-helix domain-containing protein [Actinomadura rugatobispora]|uniref:Helix-turn-helix domain-containing protein n=1 Tax=Actinomadura rugatobispora TaxID=1994 RepID=A0ABW0ZNA6_9ACTN|nr:hypothetical protein GCM10010200_035760 [Actinomadura rugatobispora]